MMLFGSEWGWLARSALRATADKCRSAVISICGVFARHLFVGGPFSHWLLMHMDMFLIIANIILI